MGICQTCYILIFKVPYSSILENPCYMMSSPALVGFSMKNCPCWCVECLHAIDPAFVLGLRCTFYSFRL
jgi:hypothetical protein